MSLFEIYHYLDLYLMKLLPLWWGLIKKKISLGVQKSRVKITYYTETGLCCVSVGCCVCCINFGSQGFDIYNDIQLVLSEGALTDIYK